ncbi:MAG: anti-sigma factor RsbA family regulatory protein [Kineosporiaceae bacterium]
MPISGTGPTQTCRHAAAVVRSAPELLELALPFLDEGLSAGDRTVFCCSPETAALLRRELGPVAASVEFDDRLAVPGSRPPDVFVRLREHLARARDGRSGQMRLLAEAGVGGAADGWREEMRAEAVFNHVMGGLPISALCLYDTRLLPAAVVASAARTHPELFSAAGWSDSPTFEAASSFVRRLPLPREPAEDLTPIFAVGDAATLPDLRHSLGAVLAAYVADLDLREDLHLGLSEVAANAFRHGVRPVSARVWVDGRRIICTISDGGRNFDDPLAGFVPAHGYDLSRGGMGLWLARKLWDHVDLISGPHGLTVRLDAVISQASTP